MIADLIDRVICRIAGERCTPERPSSKDIKAELQYRTHIAATEKSELRKQREQHALVAMMRHQRQELDRGQ